MTPQLARTLPTRALRTSYAPGEDCAFWLFDGAREDLGPLWYVRTIQASRHDSGWRWDLSGEPQDFEDLEAYTARRIHQRFERARLNAYCRALGIERETPAFYGPRALLAVR